MDDMDGLRELAYFLTDKLQHVYDDKYKVKIRTCTMQTGDRTYIISLDPYYPESSKDGLERNRIYDVGFCVEGISITYLKASHFSTTDSVDYVYYSDPKTTPERIIEILDASMEEERENARRGS
ncbi:MAG: hypothetical protein ACYSR0_12685 [Planctomycetota bacterium]|jgi:hypothetical protein